MKILNFFVLSMTVVLFFTSCEKIFYYKLTEVDKQMIPYYLGQKISFVDSLGQPFDLIVTKDTISWNGGDQEFWEQKVVELQSKNLDFYIVIVVNEAYASGQISIFISSIHIHYGIGYDMEGNFANFSNTTICYNNLLINNKIFYDVVRSVVFYDECDELGNIIGGRHKTSIYYNKTYGILQLEDKDKVVFTIDTQSE